MANLPELLKPRDGKTRARQAANRSRLFVCKYPKPALISANPIEALRSAAVAARLAERRSV